MIAKALLVMGALLSPTLAFPTAERSVASTPNPESVRHVPELAWHATGAGQEECTVVCWDQHQYNMHVADPSYPVPTNKVGGGPHTWPFAGLCADKHPGCTPGFAAIEQGIRDAIKKHDVQGLGTILEANAAIAYFASERKAIQLLGCRGEVVAHIRVTTDMQVALAE